MRRATRALPRAGRRTIRRTALLAVLLAATGCAAPKGPLSEDDRIVRAVLALQDHPAGDGGTACFENRTRDDPFMVYREMRRAPRPARAELHWFPPTPLRPSSDVTVRQLGAAEFADADLAIGAPPARTDVLPGLAQQRIDGAAQRLMVPLVPQQDVRLRPDWTGAALVSRWWPARRLRGGCRPFYVVSDVARTRDIAFVSVLGDHWGTLYALMPQGGQWRAVAQWNQWLY